MFYLLKDNDRMLGTLFKKLGVKFSLNDPQWGRNSQNDNKQNNDGKKPNNGGPPDLDKLWQDFNQRLARLLGNKNGGGGDSGGGGFNPGMKGAGVGVGAIAAVVALLWLASGFFTVQEGQTGVS